MGDDLTPFFTINTQTNAVEGDGNSGAVWQPRKVYRLGSPPLFFHRNSAFQPTPGVEKALVRVELTNKYLFH